MNILIFGAGAVGGWLGANLAQASNSITLVGRPPIVQAIQDHSLTACIASSEWRAPNARAAPSLAEATTGWQPEAVLLCVKAYDVDTAINQLAPLAARSPSLLIASFQNGVGSEEKLAAAFASRTIISGSLTSPVSMPQPGVVRLERRSGGVALATMRGSSPAAAGLADAFQRSPLLTRTYPDYRALKWSKLLLNIMANATSAILDLTPGQIYADRQLFRLELAMLRETLAVMRAAGIGTVNLPGAPAAWMASLVTWAPAGAAQFVLSRMVTRGRGSKMPSFYYDVPRGEKTAGSRPGRCEAPCLHGAIVHAAQAHGLPAPVNEQLLRVLMDLVERRQPASAWQRQASRLVDECLPPKAPR